MNKEIDVDITPDKTLIKKVGLVGYSTSEAIAELVDNSIDARWNDKKEEIAIDLDFVKKRIIVRDNGCGMNKDDLKNAMTVASGTKSSGSLGQFGIGLKSSCSALGKWFEIRTSKIGSDKEYVATYDEGKWLSDDSLNWTNFKIIEKTLDDTSNWNGTTVTINHLKVALYPNQVTVLKKNFSQRYGPYLAEGMVSIQINTGFCRLVHNEVTNGSRQNIDIDISAGLKLKGYVELLKTRSIGGQYGIDLYRHNRLIKPHVKFGFSAHPENARIIGKLNLDHVPVNFQKNDFVVESAEYKQALSKFKNSNILEEILHLVRIHGADTPSVKSVFDFFLTNSSPLHLKSSMREKLGQEILKNTEPFEVKIGKETIKVVIKSDKIGPLYHILKNGSKKTVVINQSSSSFRFVKNPLFLIGMIAAEIRASSLGHISEDFMQSRNEFMEKSLIEASKKDEKNVKTRNREIPIPDIPGYQLEEEIVELHDYLKENFAKKFQFTAMSTLVPYLHNLRGKIVYTMHVPPNTGEEIVVMLMEKFGDRFAVIDRPDAKTLRAFLNMPTVDRIIAVREFETIRGSTIAEPEKAIMDLVVESNTYGIPLETTEIERIYQSMTRHGLIDSQKIHRYAKFIKKSHILEMLAK